jgi:hypothetical protein
MTENQQERIEAEMSPTPHPYWKSVYIGAVFTHHPNEHLSNQN